jgi:hypothetical protein
MPRGACSSTVAIHRTPIRRDSPGPSTASRSTSNTTPTPGARCQCRALPAPCPSASVRGDRLYEDRTHSVPSSTCWANATDTRQIGEGISDVGQLVFRRPTRTGFQPWRPDVTTHFSKVHPPRPACRSCRSTTTPLLRLVASRRWPGRGGRERAPRTLEPVARALGVRACDPRPSAGARAGD